MRGWKVPDGKRCTRKGETVFWLACQAAAGQQGALLCFCQTRVQRALQIERSQRSAVSAGASDDSVHSTEEGLQGRAGQEEGHPQGAQMLLQPPRAQQLLHQGTCAPRRLHQHAHILLVLSRGYSALQLPSRQFMPYLSPSVTKEAPTCKHCETEPSAIQHLGCTPLRCVISGDSG